MSSRPAQAKLVRPPSQKQNTNERARGMTQVVEHLPSMCEALGSIHTTARTNQQTKIILDFKAISTQVSCIL
jgi:hypothetical protein